MLGVVTCAELLTVNVPETCRAAVGDCVAIPTLPDVLRVIFVTPLCWNDMGDVLAALRTKSVVFAAMRPLAVPLFINSSNPPDVPLLIDKTV